MCSGGAHVGCSREEETSVGSCSRTTRTMVQALGGGGNALRSVQVAAGAGELASDGASRKRWRRCRGGSQGGDERGLVLADDEDDGSGGVAGMPWRWMLGDAAMAGGLGARWRAQKWCLGGSSLSGARGGVNRHCGLLVGECVGGGGRTRETRHVGEARG